MANRTIYHTSMALYLRWLNEAMERLNRCPRAHDGGTDEWFALTMLRNLNKYLLADCIATVEIQGQVAAPVVPTDEAA